MIIGAILRNYKCYSGINYIPVSNGSKFNAFIGENGAGKSSILEALDVFFNGGSWNLNNDAVANGIASRRPHICIVLALEKNKWDTYAKRHNDKDVLSLIDGYSHALWTSKLEEFNAAHREEAKKFIAQRDSFTTISPDSHYLCAIGQQYEVIERSHLSIFGALSTIDILPFFQPAANELPKEASEREKAVSAIALKLSKFIVSNYNYIYTPAEVDVEKYTKIESKAIQKLSGKDIEDILREIIPSSTLREINRKLSEFIDGIEETLVTYQYKKPSLRQSHLNFSDLSNRVIDSYFSIRVLNKTDGQLRTPVSQLSSGEKKKALVDISHAFLSKNKDLDREVVFAMDEPEASLHTGAIFEQFERIHQISSLGVQCLITTHWYGFVPILTTGTAVNIYKNGQEIANSMMDISFYRETIRKQREQSKGLLPSDISLKSRNDLVQTIMASIRKPQPYSWIICEGTSERLYFEKYFEEEIKSNKLKILPVGGAKEVKRLFEYLELPIREDEKQITGKIFCLIDTDAQYLDCNFADYENLKFRRLLSVGGKTKLTISGGNIKTPPTEIEDSLDARLFLKTLEIFSAENSPLKELLDSIKIIDLNLCSFAAFDWRGSEYDLLKQIFDKNDFKFKFAEKYTSFIEDDCFSPCPEWIQDIRNNYI
ncbi:AAA family ATPase [Pseudomonas serbica]